MISREDDYYICQGEVAEVEASPPRPLPKEQLLEARGDIKERLAQIKERVQVLKKQKQQAVSNQKPSSWLAQVDEPDVTPIDFSLHIEIPDSVLELDRRVQKLESKILGYEIHRQKTEKKGTVVDRVKNLQKKLGEMLGPKSLESITNSIIQYSSNIDEKEEYMKQLFVYDVYTKTQGLSDELNVLEKYLNNLSVVQKKVNSLVPTEKLVKDHNQILDKSKIVRQRVEKLFEGMKKQYVELLGEIDAIEV